MSKSKYPNEITINPNQGGKAAIERLVEAYGFTTRQALADHLNVSKSTLANRYMRDTFPADWIIQCALETGVSLNWLATGNGIKQSSHKSNILEIQKRVLVNGKLCADGIYVFDTEFLPKNLKNPVVVIDGTSEYICDLEFENIWDGKWLVNIDGECSFRAITRTPGSNLSMSKENHSFECSITDIEIIAKLLLSLTH